MNNNIVNDLKPLATSLAGHINGHWMYNNRYRGDFSNIFKNNGADWRGIQTKPDRIEYYFSKRGIISFFDIRVKSINAKIDDPEMLGGQQTRKSLLLTYENPSDKDLKNVKQKLTDFNASTDEVQSDIGVSVEAAVRATLGNEAAPASLEISSKVTSEWKRAQKSSSTYSFQVETEVEFDVDATSQVTFELVEKVGPAHQRVIAEGELEFGIDVHSEGYFRDIWQSRRDLRNTLLGIDTPGYEHRNGYDESGPLTDMYRRANAPVDQLDIFKSAISEWEQYEDFTNFIDRRVVFNHEPLG